MHIQTDRYDPAVYAFFILFYMLLFTPGESLLYNKSVMRKCKLACNFRVEQKIMNVLFVRDMTGVNSNSMPY